ncbi:MAG: hypothetical protein ACRD2C_27210 [Acidimicrobiales bacterium]
MSDTPQGPDWWQASDDKWYPPPRPVMPGEDTTAYPTAPPTAPVGPGGPAGPYTPQGATPSPYGGMPAPQPGGAGGPDRTALFVALGVLVAVAGVVLVIALASGGGDDDDPQAGSTTTEDDSPATTRDVETTQPPDTTENTGPTTPGDASAIEVVEEGWSTFTDFADTPTGSYGFVVENTGDEIIMGAELSVTVYDEAEGVVKTASGTVGSLRPGQRLGLGGDLYGDDVSNGVGDIDVQVGQAQFPLEVPTDGELTVSGVDWTSDDFGLDVTFTVESTFSEQIDAPGASAVFRNAAGDIIGGASGGMSNFIPANGSTGGQVTTIENVPDVDSIEVYVDPGGYYF